MLTVVVPAVLLDAGEPPLGGAAPVSLLPCRKIGTLTLLVASSRLLAISMTVCEKGIVLGAR